MAKTKIVISVAGGNVNGIFTNILDSEIYLLDYDNLVADPDHDCRQPMRVETLEDLSRVVNREASSFPSATKLSNHVMETRHVELDSIFGTQQK